MAHTRWAVLGPGAISRDFAAGLRACSHGVLHAVGSTSVERAAAFAAVHGAAHSGTYDEILARDDVDAVYIGTVHTTHADLTVRALEAGKPVLCEKPASPASHDVDRMLASAAAVDRPFVEAYKNRFGPFADALRTLLESEEVGAPMRVEASFGFASASRVGRLFDPQLGGGAILDVGCYPVSLAVEVARAVGMLGPFSLRGVSGDVVEGVDGHAAAVVDFSGAAAGVTAALETSIVRDLPRAALILCEKGTIELPDAWGGRDASATTIVVRGRRGERVVEVPTVNPMGAEADAVSLAIADGRHEVPEIPWDDSRAIAAVLEEWRAGVLRGA
jgi:predicted dehydrogenase